MAEPHTELTELLRRFVSGEDRSQPFVRSIGDVLTEQFTPNVDLPLNLYEDLEVATACYRPGGGEFMYDEEQLATLFTTALTRLDTRLD
jgi:hypothetical protein